MHWWIALGSALGVGFVSGAAPVTVAEATALAAAAGIVRSPAAPFFLAAFPSAMHYLFVA